jgi:hypothetical protein
MNQIPVNRPIKLINVRTRLQRKTRQQWDWHREVAVSQADLASKICKRLFYVLLDSTLKVSFHRSLQIQII